MAANIHTQPDKTDSIGFRYKCLHVVNIYLCEHFGKRSQDLVKMGLLKKIGPCMNAIFLWE